MNRRVKCSCGAIVLPSYYSKHLTTKKHLSNLEYQTDSEDEITEPESKTFYCENGLKLTEKVSYVGDRETVGKVDAERNSCGCIII